MSSPSSAHRLLGALVRAGFVNHDPVAGRYSLNLEVQRLAYLAISRTPIRQVALGHMRRLTDACNETSLLGLYDSMRQEIMFAAMIDSSYPLRYSVELNKWLPVYTGATGLAILAFLDAAERAMIIQRTRLVPATSRSITDRYRLEVELQRVRDQGYAITHGQRTVGSVGLGAPVFGSNGAVIGDICLTMPESRFDKKTEKGIAELLIGCAAEVTKALGGQRK
jgi:DNA-binding IclR family transcriptional regulator